MSQKPYSGVHVVELGARIGAGACGRLLADLGATVYVVEPRSMPQPPAGKWLDRASAAACKESVLADAASADDVEAVAHLIQACDVVIRSSDLDEAHWPARWRQAISQRPIVCDITAFGTTGPLACRSGGESEIQALTGIMDTTGLPGGSPTPIGIPVIEMSSGLYAAAAIAVALGVYFRSGTGQSVEVALYDVAINTLTTFMTAHYAGNAPRRLGNGHGMAVPWNAYPTADGWILICSTNDAQWRRLANFVGPAAGSEKYAELKSRLVYRDEVDALMGDWAMSHSLDALEAMLNQGGIPCGRIVSVSNLADEPNLRFRRTVQGVPDPVSGKTTKVCGAIFRFLGQTPAPVCIPAPDSGREFVRSLMHATPAAAQVPAKEPPTQALQGLRVIEIGQLTTAPLAARHLATLGADVIKVEPPEGESARAWAPLRKGVSHFFVASNGEKRTVALDLQDASDRAYFAELLKDADVLLENMKPGALARLGFGYEQLRAINPRLVYCAISGFGIDSVYPGRAAVDTVIQAMSGMMDATRSDGTPVKTGISAADITGGQTGLLLILAALTSREKTGQGCAIDVSMQDVGAWMTQHLWNGATIPQPASPSISSVADACTHAQTRARELILLRQDANGQSWEVMASPMRLSRTPPRLGPLIGAPSRERLRWRSS
ncbi:MAG: CoA transferase [Burkholderiaceae bacterium]|nr:CoA transferase [Burkholderiaceae bacterium]